MADAAAEAVEVTRIYVAGDHRVTSLDRVSLSVERSEVVSVVGPSGSGKSTLLFLLAGLDSPNAGSVRIDGIDWSSLRGPARSAFRRRSCGFVPQGLSLLPQATAIENVEVPLFLDGIEPEVRWKRAMDALDRVGLATESSKLPDQLSGGQQQRVAIARALVNDPTVIIADEPTGSLDSETAQDVTKLLVAVADQGNAAVVLVTHDPAVAVHADRVVSLRSGRIVGEGDITIRGGETR